LLPAHVNPVTTINANNAMRIAMLIVHFLGLAMGVGTSFAFFFLGASGSKMEKKERQKFTLNTFALSTMAHIGLTLLIFSGLYLMTPYWKSLATRPLLIAKLCMVLLLTVSISVISIYQNRARKGETESNLKKISALGKVSLVSGIIIVLLAVLNFR
jgi:uncharacterized membrane protein